jgi:hypothetical protein
MNRTLMFLAVLVFALPLGAATNTPTRTLTPTKTLTPYAGTPTPTPHISVRQFSDGPSLYNGKTNLKMVQVVMSDSEGNTIAFSAAGGGTAGAVSVTSWTAGPLPIIATTPIDVRETGSATRAVSITSDTSSLSATRNGYLSEIVTNSASTSGVLTSTVKAWDYATNDDPLTGFASQGAAGSYGLTLNGAPAFEPFGRIGFTPSGFGSASGAGLVTLWNHQTTEQLGVYNASTVLPGDTGFGLPTGFISTISQMAVRLTGTANGTLTQVFSDGGRVFVSDTTTAQALANLLSATLAVGTTVTAWSAGYLGTSITAWAVTAPVAVADTRTARTLDSLSTTISAMTYQAFTTGGSNPNGTVASTVVGGAGYISGTNAWQVGLTRPADVSQVASGMAGNYVITTGTPSAASPPAYNTAAQAYESAYYSTFTAGAKIAAPIWTTTGEYASFDVTVSAPGSGTPFFMTPSAKTKLTIINAASNSQTVYFRRSTTSTVPTDCNFNFEEIAPGSTRVIDGVTWPFGWFWAPFGPNASRIRTIYERDANWTGTSFAP